MNINAIRRITLSLFGALACQNAPVLSAPESAPSPVVKTSVAESTTPALTPAQEQAVVAAAKKQLAAFGGKTPIPGVYIARLYAWQSAVCKRCWTC